MYKHLIKPYQYYTPIYPTSQKPPQNQTSRTIPIERSSFGQRPMSREDKKKRIFGSGFVKPSSSTLK